MIFKEGNFSTFGVVSLSSIDNFVFTQKKWFLLKNEVLNCYKCKLHSTGIFPIFGEGSLKSKVVFIGEAPGAVENKLKRPFVGSSGLLLREYISQVELSDEDVFITNIVKCRPSNNRDPDFDEISACSPYLTQQLELMRPKLIVTLGKFATQFFIREFKGMTSVVGKIFQIKGSTVLPMFHPATCLYNRQKYDPILKRDFLALKKYLEDYSIISGKKRSDKKEDRGLVGLDFFLDN